MIICSAAILDGHMAALESLKVDQFLSKPYRPKELLNRIAIELNAAAPTARRVAREPLLPASRRADRHMRTPAGRIPCSSCLLSIYMRP